MVAAQMGMACLRAIAESRLLLPTPIQWQAGPRAVGWYDEHKVPRRVAEAFCKDLAGTARILTEKNDAPGDGVAHAGVPKARSCNVR